MDSLNGVIVEFTRAVRDIYGGAHIPLHRPIFEGNERQYVLDCIESNFVSSVGEKVAEFEEKVAAFTESRHAIATVNGTAALHTAIELAGVQPGDEVISQALTFVATCNAITYAGAVPVFIDVDVDTMGLSPRALRKFLEKNVKKTPTGAINKSSGKKIAACVPMHTFGLPCRIREIAEICDEWNIVVIEDAAESLGSYVAEKHTGRYSSLATLSFNGNKIITTGGGGMIITDDSELARRAKHITTTAKIPHAYEFFHDEVGYNYRMPNLNSALGCAQMERIDEILAIKSTLANRWADFFEAQNIGFAKAIAGAKANNWLNAVILDSKNERNIFLERTNKNNINTRPIWKLMSDLPIYSTCQKDALEKSSWLADRVVNIPSSVPDNWLI